MKKSVASVLCMCWLVPLVFAASQKELIRNLPPRYRTWLQEEVVYIISPVERDVFLKLENDRERELFISAFWKQRNPNPNLPENEFKKEHYRRFEYANQWFGRESPGPGWRTDRGRIYILLGEPKQIDRHESVTGLCPMQIWFYEGMAKFGLPQAFNVVFFRPDNAGDYVLYSPVKNGPQSLLTTYVGDPNDVESAYGKIYEIDPTIAEISLNLIPGDKTSLSLSIPSELLVHEKIPAFPQRMVSSIYAEKLLKYKELVEVDSADMYIENAAQVSVLRDDRGTYFVHYLIEPKKLSLENYQGKFFTTLEVYGNVTDLAGNVVSQIRRVVPIEFRGDQIEKIQNKLFSFQDEFPLIEGKYRLSVLIKNKISKEFTSIEQDLVVPKGDPLRISPLILANRLIENPDLKGKYKPFSIGTRQLVPSPRNDFLAQDNLTLFFQLGGLSKDLVDSGLLEYTLFRREEKVLSLTKSLRDYADPRNIFETFPLQGYSPAMYKVRVTLMNRGKIGLAFEDSDFYITPMSMLPRPWVMSFPVSASSYASFFNEMGNQHFNRKDYASARPLLERAARMEPQSVKFGLDLCQWYLQQKQYAALKEFAGPRFAPDRGFEYGQPLGAACQNLGEFEAAIKYYSQYLAHTGTNLLVLNAIGDCHAQLGQKEDALAAWKKSLEINPKQEEVKKKYAKLGGDAP